MMLPNVMSLDTSPKKTFEKRRGISFTIFDAKSFLILKIDEKEMLAGIAIGPRLPCPMHRIYLQALELWCRQNTERVKADQFLNEMDVVFVDV